MVNSLKANRPVVEVIRDSRTGDLTINYNSDLSGTPEEILSQCRAALEGTGKLTPQEIEELIEAQRVGLDQLLEKARSDQRGF